MTDRSQIELGRSVFSEETFDGKDRVCSTCHSLDHFGTIAPEYIRDLFAQDPAAPLFRAIDSDGGLGVSYERLENEATIRVPVDLSADGTSDLVVRKCDAPEETIVFIHRGIPTVFNAALEDFLMHDGRDRDDLKNQALNALRVHSEAGRDPTNEELAAIEAFERSLFSHATVKAFLESGTVPELPDGTTQSEIRGPTDRVEFATRVQCLIGPASSGRRRSASQLPRPVVDSSLF